MKAKRQFFFYFPVIRCNSQETDEIELGRDQRERLRAREGDGIDKSWRRHDNGSRGGE
jgi:hypothetical protein